MALDMGGARDYPYCMVGARIRTYRRALGLTQAQLAAAMNGHQVTIGKLEANLYPLNDSILARVAKALGVSPADLLKE